MRSRLAMMMPALAGCSLYLGSGPPAGDDVPPDAGPYVPQSCDIALATCADGVVTLSEYPDETCAELRPPRAVYTCPTACTTDYMGLCFDPDCAGPEDLCTDPPAQPLPAVEQCPASPACTTDGTETCGGLGLCGQEIRVGTCTCEAGVRTCTPACADGLCSAEAVQAALAGTWRGTVSTPWETYEATLTITPDGHYISERPGQGAVFYYGADGGGDARRFHVVGQTDLGAIAVVRVFFYAGSITDGLARGIRIDGDRLRFDFVDAWLDCTGTMQFDLQRQP